MARVVSGWLPGLLGPFVQVDGEDIPARSHLDFPEGTLEDDPEGDAVRITFPGAAPGGGEGNIQFAGAGAAALEGSSDLSWDDGIKALQMGDGASATGAGSQAIGPDAVADQTYAIAIGKGSISHSAAGVAIGEFVEVKTGAANGVCIGFSSFVNTGCTYGVAIGSYCYSTASHAFACGLNCASSRPGQFAHGSGITNVQGGNAIDLARTLNATSGALQDYAGAAFRVTAGALTSMRIRLMGAKLSAGTVNAHEIHELLIHCTGAGVVTIVDDITTAAAPVGSPDGFAANGWSVAFSAPGSSELRITCNSGSDNVRFSARLEWSESTGLT